MVAVCCLVYVRGVLLVVRLSIEHVCFWLVVLLFVIGSLMCVVCCVLVCLLAVAGCSVEVFLLSVARVARWFVFCCVLYVVCGLWIVVCLIVCWWCMACWLLVFVLCWFVGCCFCCCFVFFVGRFVLFVVVGCCCCLMFDVCVCVCV